MLTRVTPLVSVFFIALMSVTLVRAQSKTEKTVLFVCEHGSAKSVVAAAHFRKTAVAKGMKIKTISRGTNPDESIPDKVNEFLASDGLDRAKQKPVKLTPKDLESADYVIAFSPLPSNFGQVANLEMWDIPSFEKGYPVARDSMLVHIDKLIEKIKSENRK